MFEIISLIADGIRD